MLEEDFEEYVSESEEILRSLKRRLENLELSTMLSEPDDEKGCILTIKPGAGGTESQDWAQMLMRMYLHYFESQGYIYNIIDLQPGEEAGIKSCAIEISGDHPYGYLRAEIGVHRLVRISPFDSNARRHTSFTSIFVFPEVEETDDIKIDSSDLRIDTYRSGGAGGQHVNMTDSAVRITHLPTGIVASCQDERSQLKNREKAMKVLMAKLYEKEQEEQRKEIESNRKLQVGTGERSEKIRTYNFPQGRFTDHRINLTLYKLDYILEGELDEVIDALTTFDQAEKLQQVV